MCASQCVYVLLYIHLHLSMCLHLCVWTSVHCKCLVAVCTPRRLLLICGLSIPVDSEGVHAERRHQSLGEGVKIDGIQMCLLTLDIFFLVHVRQASSQPGNASGSLHPATFYNPTH